MPEVLASARAKFLEKFWLRLGSSRERGCSLWAAGSWGDTSQKWQLQGPRKGTPAGRMCQTQMCSQFR